MGSTCGEDARVTTSPQGRDVEPFHRASSGPTILDVVRARTESVVKKGLAVFLIVGFLLVDLLFFHDILKPGEVITFPQFLTGVLSVPVLVLSALYLLRGEETRPAH
jgi:hypothetical protein